MGSVSLEEWIVSVCLVGRSGIIFRDASVRITVGALRAGEDEEDEESVLRSDSFTSNQCFSLCSKNIMFSFLSYSLPFLFPFSFLLLIPSLFYFLLSFLVFPFSFCFFTFNFRSLSHFSLSFFFFLLPHVSHFSFPSFSCLCQFPYILLHLFIFAHFTFPILPSCFLSFLSFLFCFLTFSTSLVNLFLFLFTFPYLF